MKSNRRHRQYLTILARFSANFLATSAPLGRTSACRMLAILKKEQNAIKFNQVIATHTMRKWALNPLNWSYLLIRSGPALASGKLIIKMLNWLAVGCVKALSGPIIIAS